jgi:tetratricopeptide (TPR) repeat protein
MAETFDEPEAEARDVLEQESAAGMALALGRAGRGDKRLDARAEQFLDKQSRLIDLQTEHLHEQRLLILSRLRLGRWKDRVSLTLQGMTVAVGLAIAAGLGWMAWSASQERGLVIEAFSVPPDLAARGITGQVIASKMLDRLGELQAATTSARAASTYANNWNDEIKVEIPETGVSVSELQRLLVSWLGHQTRITGELYRTPTGIALSARTGTAPAKTREGAETDLDALVRQAAEDLYDETQPYRYAAWLTRDLDPQSDERAEQRLRDLASRGDKLERVWAFNGLSVIFRREGDLKGVTRALSAGQALEPRFSQLYNNMAGAEGDRGHVEAQLAQMRTAATMSRRYGRLFMSPEANAFYPAEFQGIADERLGDFAGAARVEAPALTDLFAPYAGRETLIRAQALDHDPAAAEASFALFPSPRADTSVQAGNNQRWLVARARQWIALAREDWAGAAQAYASIDEASLTPGVRLERRTFDAPLAALALARLGNIQGAEALISATPTDCYDCVRVRGQLAAMAHDWPAAERWFAEAAPQGPSLPFAEADWGRALLDRGDAAGAIAKLDQAHRKSPNFADPLETWGEALMAQRDWAGAAAKFAEADKDAPKWGRNHLMWGEALLLAGRYALSRAQFETADGLDLTAPDRAALNVLLARTARGPLHG